MKDETLIHKQMNEFNTFINDLLGTNVKIDDGEQTILLLDNLIISLSYIIKLDMDSVVASLL